MAERAYSDDECFDVETTPSGQQEEKFPFVRFCTKCGQEIERVGAYGFVRHDDETLPKVYRSLREAGIPEELIAYAVGKMLNNGILFREKV